MVLGTDSTSVILVVGWRFSEWMDDLGKKGGIGERIMRIIGGEFVDAAFVIRIESSSWWKRFG